MYARKKALLMIDMQKGFIDPVSPLCIRNAAGTIPACVSIINFCHSSGIPVFYVTRKYRADGTDVEKARLSKWLADGKPLSDECSESISALMPESFEVFPQDYLIIKPRFSAFFHTELDLILRRLGVETVVLAGTTTPNCIRTTCYDALSLDYNVEVLSDCTSSSNDEIQKSNLSDMGKIGAKIITSESFITFNKNGE